MRIFKFRYKASTLIELIVAQTIIMIASVLFVVSIVFSLKSFNNEFLLQTVTSADRNTEQSEDMERNKVIRKEEKKDEIGNGLFLIETEWYGKGDTRLINNESIIDYE